VSTSALDSRVDAVNSEFPIWTSGSRIVRFSWRVVRTLAIPTTLGVPRAGFAGGDLDVDCFIPLCLVCAPLFQNLFTPPQHNAPFTDQRWYLQPVNAKSEGKTIHASPSGSPAYHRPRPNY
jgi:hypothetical protein